MYQSSFAAQQFSIADQKSAGIAGRKQEKSGQWATLASATSALAESITREASSQTYLTIRTLVDRPLVADAYRAYAYFRWVDDGLDGEGLAKVDRLAFLARQEEIIARCYQGDWPGALCPEEGLIADLIRGDQGKGAGLRTYIDEMMAVMVFDAERRGRLISQVELTAVTRSLATAVTEAMHYFIGNEAPSPPDQDRYQAVTGAHITHMLRDAIEDAAVGYYNIPREYLEAHGVSPNDVDHEAYRVWVRGRVQLARQHFAAGALHMARVKNLRCRLAGFAYIARFEVVLDAIERDEYRLRVAYPERKSKRTALKMAWAALSQTIRSLPSGEGAPNPHVNPTLEVI